MNLNKKHWHALIQLKDIIDSNEVSSDLFLNKEVFWAKEPNQDDLLHIGFNTNSPEILSSSLDEKEYKQFELYLSYLRVNKNDAMAKVFLHVAQTLDGKIALNNGKSQWIGNKANRIHSHRIRALVDAVMIGGNTFRIDDPKLNVRHVEGNNPRIVVITGKQINFRPHQKKSIVFTYNTTLNLANDFKGEVIVCPAENDRIPISFILKELKKRGIHTVLLEGGQSCIKQFISEQLIHQLEFHIAPMIFGSGMDAVRLNEIEDIDKSIFLNDVKYHTVDGEIMVVSQNINYAS